jgi:hypothetical protein
VRLSRWDIIAKSDDFIAASERARLSRWKWEMLEAVDGTRDIGAVAARKLLDTASAIAFAEEALEANLVRLVTLSYNEFLAKEAPADTVAAPVTDVEPMLAPEPEPVLAIEPEAVLAIEPEPAPEPEPIEVLATAPEPVVIPEPAPVPIVAAAVEPPPVVVAEAAPAPVSALLSAPTSLAERMAALRARALKSLEKPTPEAYASVEPPMKVEPVEFSLSSEPKPEPARSADEIEFSV